MQQSEGPEYLGSFCDWSAAWCQILMTLGWLHLIGNFEVKWYDFEKKNIEHKMCVLMFSRNSSEASLILRRIQRDMIIKVQGVS